MNVIKNELDVHIDEYDNDRVNDLVDFANAIRADLNRANDAHTIRIVAIELFADITNSITHAARQGSVTFEYDRDNLANRDALEYVTGLEYDELDSAE